MKCEHVHTPWRYHLMINEKLNSDNYKLPLPIRNLFQEYSIDWVMEFMQEHCNQNRTIVSSYNYHFFNCISKKLPFKISRFKTGEDHSTWLIPVQWDVVEAELKDLKGKLIASYEDHPLFLAPYSIDFEGEVTKDELLKRVLTKQSRPNDFIYQHRLALNFQLRLKDWSITLPYNLVQRLEDDKYFVKIKTKISDGELLVGEYQLKGRRPNIFAILSHMCHPGQVNDGIGGVALGMALMEVLKMRGNLQFTYELLVMPETFGSAVYLSANENKIQEYFGSIFLEMPGQGKSLTMNHSRKGFLYFDYVLKYAIKANYHDINEFPFHRGMCNDEMNFDWPGVDIPGLAIYWDSFQEYHTSSDSPKNMDLSKMKIYFKALVHFIDIIERDYIPKFTQRVQVYQTRYNLYVDFFNQQDLYYKITDLLYGLDGEKSLFEVSHNLGISFEDAYDYIEQYVQLGFIQKCDIPIERYKRNLN
jgi:aminopeptidase-like protein